MTSKAKARGNGEGSIFRRTDGRWCAQVSLGYEGGRRKRKTVYGDTRREVKDQLTKLMHDKQRGLPVSMERQTVEQFLKHWLEDLARPSIRPSTYRSYEQLVRIHIAPRIGRVQLSKLTPQHVQTLLQDCSGSGLSPRTVAYIHATLRNALNRAVRWDLLVRNPAALVDPPRAEQHEFRVLTVEEAGRFLNAIKDHRLEGLYTVAISLGLRQGEALGLTWNDVAFDAGTITIRGQLQRVDGKLQIVPTKTSRSRRTIALPAVTLNALRRHRVRQLEERTAAGGRWQEYDFVFTTTIGTPLDGRNVTQDFQQLLLRNGLPRLRFHDLRHTAATLLLAQGVHVRTIMEILGHSQISLTMNTYAHVMPTMQRDAAEKMDAILLRKPS